MKSPVPFNVGAYADVSAILNQALRTNGGRYTLPTRGQAVKWRQRAYTLRGRLRAAAAEACPAGELPSTPFDEMFLTISPDPTLRKEGPHTVVIGFRVATGDFVGNEEPAALDEEDVLLDPMQQAANEFVAKLRGEG